MGGSPEDWRHVQARQPGISLPIDTKAASPEEAALKFMKDAEDHASGSFALCGYSMGGRLALLAAAGFLDKRRKPDSLILVSSGLGLENESERSARNAQDEEWALLAEKNRDDFWKAWYQQDLFKSYHSVAEAKRAAWEESRKSMDISALTSQLRKLGPGRHENLVPLLKNLTSKGMRVLYLAGELDKKYVETSKQVQGIPGVTVETIPGAGHVLPLEAPEALAMRLIKFLK
jgi:2-succinyl-6-hydroxy-2,4-cyclohexadiene-1-carboxylate synthase